MSFEFVENDIYQRLETIISWRYGSSGPNKLKSGSKVTKTIYKIWLKIMV